MIKVITMNSVKKSSAGNFLVYIYSINIFKMLYAVSYCFWNK